MATAADVLTRLSHVETQIHASGREMINTPEDRKRHVDYLLEENRIEEALEYVCNLAKITV